ncbi:excalibur calcium-binding domain-containing protein [Ponticaulis sp.]|uniref:excalibur calcium-binding domain-containing protein n=1 Tax=Ponticaulis sp. TaxID=2020902 RepID=UPI0025E2F8D9|nr:excalibur calcium-binding domain-containing protein [Ponticaulis sp.]
MVTILLGCIVGVMCWDVIRHPWPAHQTVLHWLAAPDCDAARAVGLAPSNRGEPGYYNKHDGDDDGIACEVWPR